MKTADDIIDDLKAEIPYHEEKEGPVDNLIEYKDAVEGLAYRALQALTEARMYVPLSNPLHDQINSLLS